MTSVWRALLLGLAACWSILLPARAADVAVTAPRDVAEHQILVLLRMPPEHYRPNSDYGDSYGEGLGRSARHRIADRLAHEHGLTLVTDWPLPLAGVDCFVMAVPADQSVGDVVAALSRDPSVAWSQPMNTFHGQASTAPVPNDPLYRVEPVASEWRLTALHEIATGRNVRVAVIDSMVQADHPDLVGQVAMQENFVVGQPNTPEQHGTGVAGIIAAKADNGVGIAGVAPQARLLALRACWQTTASGGAVSTVCDSLSLAKALHFAITHDAQVINLSLSGPPDPLLSQLLDIAIARGDTVVSAFDRDLPAGGFPASHPGVVSVIDELAQPAPTGVFSAPGRDIPTTQPGGRWYLVSGSSYAAAHVTGLFALLRERAPRADTASALVARPPEESIDACATLIRAIGPCGCGCSRPRQYSAVPYQ